MEDIGRAKDEEGWMEVLGGAEESQRLKEKKAREKLKPVMRTEG